MPKSTRVTVPEGHVAIIVPHQLAGDFHNLGRLIRRTTRKTLELEPAVRRVADDLILATDDAFEEYNR